MDRALVERAPPGPSVTVPTPTSRPGVTPGPSGVATASPEPSATPDPSVGSAAVEHCGASTFHQLDYSLPGMEAVEVTCDITYGQVDGLDATLDLYIPPGTDATARLPVVVFVHGNDDLADPLQPIREHWKRDGYSVHLVATPRQRRWSRCRKLDSRAQPRPRCPFTLGAHRACRARQRSAPWTTRALRLRERLAGRHARIARGERRRLAVGSPGSPGRWTRERGQQATGSVGIRSEPLAGASKKVATSTVGASVALIAEWA